MFRDTVGIGVTDPTVPDRDLFPEEAHAIRSAVEKRKREFAAGRVAARAAMERIGAEPHPIPMADDRSPHWPVGLIGSITHCDDMCLAAVAQSTNVRAIGIDIEPNTPLDDDLLVTVCQTEERDWLSRQPAGQRGKLAKVIFSAKESAYKAQYPLSKTLFGYEGLSVTPNLSAGRFTARFRVDAPPFRTGGEITGSIALTNGYILTSAIIPL
ncbi:4'-phosphopantetheinyl transferase family protein [Aliiroseovarius sp. YM-037]|uniref:4'-phosphopantetheinyl transferase family protein n=1 Tax=Aliiroseovarius sp. YM-037 TaxID=3341728 RepID=UPI003A80FE03